MLWTLNIYFDKEVVSKSYSLRDLKGLYSSSGWYTRVNSGWPIDLLLEFACLNTAHNVDITSATNDLLL